MMPPGADAPCCGSVVHRKGSIISTHTKYSWGYTHYIEINDHKNDKFIKRKDKTKNRKRKQRGVSDRVG